MRGVAKKDEAMPSSGSMLTVLRVSLVDIVQHSAGADDGDDDGSETRKKREKQAASSEQRAAGREKREARCSDHVHEACCKCLD